MKAKDLKFPLTLYWYGGTFEVTKGRVGLNWTVIHEDGTKGITYENSQSADSIVKALADGAARIVVPATIVPVSTLSLNVDTTELAKAVSLAKELEATLLRIKGMLA